jgi:hypothetical protein
MSIDYWTIYGHAEPAPDPANPPPPCLGQVWVRLGETREGLVNDVTTEGGVRYAHCFGVPHGPDQWPPEGAVLVSGPYAPWRGE